MTITRDGRPVAPLEPLDRGRLSAATPVERLRRLPAVDPEQLRRDVDAVVEQRS